MDKTEELVIATSKWLLQFLEAVKITRVGEIPNEINHIDRMNCWAEKYINEVLIPEGLVFVDKDQTLPAIPPNALTFTERVVYGTAQTIMVNKDFKKVSPIRKVE